MPMYEEDSQPWYGGIPHPVHGAIDFVGEIFLWGLAGGSAFHLVRGLRHGGHLAAGVQAVRANALRVAGAFGAYSAFFSGIEIAVSVARGREDVWCPISASAVTWGLHGMRRGGAPAAARCAFLGVTAVVAIAGIDHAIMEWQSRNNFLLREKWMMERGKPASQS